LAIFGAEGEKAESYATEEAHWGIEEEEVKSIFPYRGKGNRALGSIKRIGGGSPEPVA